MPDEPKDDAKPHPFSSHIDTYVDRLESLHVSLLALMPMFQVIRQKAAKDANEYINAHVAGPSSGGEGEKNADFKPQEYLHFRRLNNRFQRLNQVYHLFPQSLIVSFVSQYDALLSHFIRAIFYIQPDALNSSDRQISFSELMSYGSIDAARERIIEKEVESVLRRSHADHFHWLEGKLKISLRSGLTIWPAFIEITERRNLLVHAEGTVSSQYLDVCAQHKVVHEDKGISPGTRLHLTAKYVRATFLTMMEIGIKLGHVMWRKLLPDELDEADLHLNNLVLDCIKRKYHDLAAELVDFRMALPVPMKGETRLFFQINLAQTYKWKKQPQLCTETLAKIDWEPLSQKYKLAKMVLDDRFDDAATIMIALGKSDEISEVGYRDWPLFREFRKSPQFERAFTSIFGTSFKFTTGGDDPVQELFLAADSQQELLEAAADDGGVPGT